MLRVDCSEGLSHIWWGTAHSGGRSRQPQSRAGWGTPRSPATAATGWGERRLTFLGLLGGFGILRGKVTWGDLKSGIGRYWNSGEDFGHNRIEPSNRCLMPRPWSHTQQTLQDRQPCPLGTTHPFPSARKYTSLLPPRHLMSPSKRKAGECREEGNAGRQNSYPILISLERDSDWKNNIWV